VRLVNSVLIGLFIVLFLLRLATVAVSLRNEKRLKASGAVEYGKTNSIALTIAHVLFYFAALGEGLWRATQPSLWTTIGIAFYLLSIIALLLVWRELRDLWTVKLIIAANHTLNQSALFRWLRHPNYFLNILPELIGLALILGAWFVLFLGLPLYLIVLRARIVTEERVMKEHFPRY